MGPARNLAAAPDDLKEDFMVPTARSCLGAAFLALAAFATGGSALAAEEKRFATIHDPEYLVKFAMGARYLVLDITIDNTIPF